MQMPTTYIVATEFPTLGFGSAGDITAEWSTAYDQFAECRDDDQPARVFVLEFDVETNTPEAFRDITDEMQAEYEAICERHGYATAAE